MNSVVVSLDELIAAQVYDCLIKLTDDIFKTVNRFLDKESIVSVKLTSDINKNIEAMETIKSIELKYFIYKTKYAHTITKCIALLNSAKQLLITAKSDSNVKYNKCLMDKINYSIDKTIELFHRYKNN